jgi:hypothetical protein
MAAATSTSGMAAWRSTTGEPCWLIQVQTNTNSPAATYQTGFARNEKIILAAKIESKQFFFEKKNQKTFVL